MPEAPEHPPTTGRWKCGLLGRVTILRSGFVGAALLGLLSGHVMGQAGPATSAPPATPPGNAGAFAKDGQVWGGLMYAASKPPPTTLGHPVPQEMGDVVKRLEKVFPAYSHFELLGQHNQVVFREYESWVVPSREVFIKVDSKGTMKDGGLNLHIQFWQGQNVLVKTDTVLRKGSPLVIGGPKWRDGQIVFVLVLRDPEAEKKTAAE